MDGKMYPETKTWNPFLGCLYDCVYCDSSFKKVLRWIGGRTGCQDCQEYRPHEHPERSKTLRRDWRGPRGSCIWKEWKLKEI